MKICIILWHSGFFFPISTHLSIILGSGEERDGHFILLLYYFSLGSFKQQSQIQVLKKYIGWFLQEVEQRYYTLPALGIHQNIQVGSFKKQSRDIIHYQLQVLTRIYRLVPSSSRALIHYQLQVLTRIYRLVPSGSRASIHYQLQVLTRIHRLVPSGSQL